jgi:PAS domain-containing protein
VAQKEIEVILFRQLAATLALPVFIVDTNGTLIFYNEPAERILGTRYEETGEMPADEWSIHFTPSDSDGNAVPSDELPLVRALADGRPSHLDFFIVGYDQVRRHIEITAFPLIGQGGRKMGAVAIFWEVVR